MSRYIRLFGASKTSRFIGHRLRNCLPETEDLCQKAELCVCAAGSWRTKFEWLMGGAGLAHLSWGAQVDIYMVCTRHGSSGVGVRVYERS